MSVEVYVKNALMFMEHVLEPVFAGGELFECVRCHQRISYREMRTAEYGGKFEECPGAVRPQ